MNTQPFSVRKQTLNHSTLKLNLKSLKNLKSLNLKLLCNFIEIAFRHGCSPVNLLRIFRRPFPNTSEELLLHFSSTKFPKTTKNAQFQNCWFSSYLFSLSILKVLTFFLWPFQFDLQISIKHIFFCSFAIIFACFHVL